MGLIPRALLKKNEKMSQELFYDQKRYCTSTYKVTLCIRQKVTLCIRQKKVTLCITQEVYYGFSQLYGQGAPRGKNRAE